MASTNVEGSSVPAIAPTRSDDQILPYNEWVPIGKSNIYLRADNPHNHPIFKMALDLLKQTSFFRAFTASATIPSIYVQQFWNTIRFDRSTSTYICKIDEQQVNITKDTLASALHIMPTGDNVEFIAPPNNEDLREFVNEIGYPSEVAVLSSVVTYDMYQPWRAVSTLINLCLTGKTSGYERIRAPSLQILWGIVHKKNLDYAELIWEEFSYSIQSFLEDRANLAANKGSKKRSTKLLIPSIRFTKLIISHLQHTLHFHPRSDSPLHQSTDENVVGFLKYTAKGTNNIIFGMAIPQSLLTRNILEAPYYSEYLKLLTASQEFDTGSQSQSTQGSKQSTKKRKGGASSGTTSGRSKMPKKNKGGEKSSPKTKKSYTGGTPEPELISPEEAEMTQLAIQESLKETNRPPAQSVKGIAIN